MNIQQLQIVIAAAETKSISQAASNLYISQPSASGTIKALEQELGFSIFRRTHTGISLTQKGAQFLEHARVMVSHANEIEKINTQKTSHYLHVGVSSYTPLFRAFLHLREKYSQEANTEFSCKNIDPVIGIQELCQLKLDLLVLILTSYSLLTVRHAVLKHSLIMQKIIDLPLYINLRQGHPLANGSDFDMRELKDYSYVDYLETDFIGWVNRSLSGNDAKITYKSCIKVDERHLRCEIVSSSNAFSIGCKLPQDVLDKFRLINYPLPGEPLQLHVVLRQGDQVQPDIKEYISFLKNEITP